MTQNCSAVELAWMKANWEGIWLTMLTKMISDMPLPTPRWVINSPSHMMKAVPAVIVSTMISTRPGV